MSKLAVGVDIGGTGIKSAPVDLATGEFTEERYRILTPQPATLEAVGKAVGRAIDFFEPADDTPVGVAFPGVVQHGIVRSAAHVEDEWLGANLEEVIHEHTGRRVHVMNDADAAGFAEYRYGAAHGEDGLIMLVTLGTGIGTALIADGHLVPNTELGHIIIDGKDAEEYAAESARERHGFDWEDWIPHLQRYFSEMERLLSPDLFIVGGGVSKSHHMFLPHLELRAPIVPAELRNGAGIAGAAALAAQADRHSAKLAHKLRKRAKKDKKRAKRD